MYATCWSVPLVFQDSLAGVMQFGFAAFYEWLPREVELLSAAAERCALAAEKANLIEDLAAGENQVRRLAERLLQVEDRERRRLSTELHDEAGQSLLCIRLQLEMLEKCVPPGHADLATGLAEVRALTEKTIIEIRRLISALSPAVLDQLGLAAALRQLRTRFERVHKAQVTLQLGQLGDLNPQTASAVYRLVQECLNNISKYAMASLVKIKISLNPDDGRLTLCVEDNGVGFCKEEALSKRDSFGLAGMRERVALLGGEFDLDSRPGRGTRVLVSLPAEPRRETSDPGS
jgi:signal transduction histidine kinase